MMTLVPSALPPTGPSPARNPFARPKLPSAGSFSRTSLLPTHVSPRKVRPLDPVTTPADKEVVTSKGSVSAGKEKSKSWRLLWRGGLEVGESGWRLEGIMFYAMMAFPSTPSHSVANPFDFISPPTTSTGATAGAASPFALPSADTDLCLSLESMRGRKHLKVRGLTDLPADEVLEGDTGDSGVQVSVNPQTPLLAGYLTSVLCRTGKLSSQGRTLTAIVIGLGDEGADPTHNSSLLIYGQAQTPNLGADGQASGETRPILKLCVARRKPPPPPPSVRKVRPGEPLPRAPLFLLQRQPSKNLSHRPLSRANSSASIYAPPILHTQSSNSILKPVSRSHSSGPVPDKQLPPAPVSGRTPGRRGEKRRRLQDEEDDQQKKRKNGKIVLVKEGSRTTETEQEEAEEDIFGKHSAVKSGIKFELPQSTKAGTFGEAEEGAGAEARSGEEPPSTARKRSRVPQQILDNKATIRKQTLLLLESSGYPRDHDVFKEVFSMITKGTYFAFRHGMETGPLCKLDVQRVVGIHVGMYTPPSSEPQSAAETEPDKPIVDQKPKFEREDTEVLRSIKEEDEEEETLVDICDAK